MPESNKQLLTSVPVRMTEEIHLDKAADALPYFRGSFRLNESALQIVELSAGKLSVSEIIEMVSSKYASVPDMDLILPHIVKLYRRLQEEALLLFSDW